MSINTMSDNYPTLLISLKYINEKSQINFEKEIELDLKEFDNFSEFLSIISKKINQRVTNSSKFHIKILYEDDWVNLIDLKSFYFFVSNNILLNEMTKMKIESKEVSQEKEIDFNIQGEKFENDKASDSNRPNMKIYEFDNQEVFCVFCKDSSKDEYKLQKLGPFYGPFKKGNKSYYMHELCAIWSPKIFLDGNGKLKNVLKEIDRCKKKGCAYCGELGGGIGCEYKYCKREYHYLCAKSVGCLLDDQKYLIFCPAHKNSINEEEMDLYLNRKEIEPDNYSDLLCMECMSGLDEDKILICDICNKGVHTYCHIPELIDLPPEEEKFFCNRCMK